MMTYCLLASDKYTFPPFCIHAVTQQNVCDGPMDSDDYSF